ncbi:putative GNAT family N-acyltransferase [Thermolongibacillus altinsuensis]|jgi:predicted GNAT family N-acyltransferase|uniref:Putative GNAT family N-acyltransferase n=1 Tax=Thermolongibacillus altinsuensis TaxID=575256 RepID=A0A4R1QPZ4_9BACL|nr:GNAT family N-acetyltransferase [Thermolongibacillus altinsuensis]TCL50965.1 putative GNAT family N-acyltransferase [Thermolongibacillus altinsuensis]GMB08966.1 N-acetyltransferase [Thermolongibacillus altinsuensis]
MNVKFGKEKSIWNDALFVRRKVFVEEQNVPVEEEIDQFENESVHFVVYDQDEPIAAGRFRTIEGIGKIERICVLREHRQRGIGKLIMEKIEQFAREQGIQKAKLNAQTHAQPFYEKLGYETVSDVFLDAGIPHVTMVKQL